jgi:hypothetical protein
MAGASDSNDASEIFWPGYVDAIANLAINLLFVIAVMCIVILSFVLEETVKSASPQENLPESTASAAVPTVSVAAPDVLDALAAENAKLKAEVEALKKQSTTTQKSIERASAPKEAVSSAAPTQKASAQATASSSAAADVAVKAKRQDVVDVREEASKNADQGSATSEAVSAGLIINFDPKAVTLSPKESADIAALLPSYGSLTGGRWQITVITPKGFSEAGRLAYYRAVAVRNVLLQSGAPGSAIDIRVLESSQPGANNARVTVNALP